MARIIAVSNQKGGVGKTTTTVNLGAYLAKAGKKVLIIDMDSQGNTSSGLGIDRREITHSIYDTLIDGTSLESIIIQTGHDRLSLAPSAASLAAVELELVSAPEREYRLRRALSAVRGYYDFILLDCPPSLGLLTINALSSSTDVLIPVQTEYYALEGLGQLTETITRVRGRLNPELRLLGIVLTMNDRRTLLSREIAEELERYFPGKVFRSVIPRNVKLAEAPSFGQTILEYDRRSKGAKGYKSLAREVILASA